jgi:uncharacterized surface protein with fasciclin (FAS1) repeats
MVDKGRIKPQLDSAYQSHVTVFAPVDEQLKQLNTDGMDSMEARNFVLYHMLPRRTELTTLMSSPFMALQTKLPAYNIHSSMNGNNVILNRRSCIIGSDTSTVSGILYIINKPLWPPVETEPFKQY